MKKWTLIFAVIILVSFVLYQLILQYQIRTECLLLLEENDEMVSHMTGINVTEQEDSSYYIVYSERWYRKKILLDLSSVNSLEMVVIKKGNLYDIKSRLLSSTLYKKGEAIGHADPSPEWSEFTASECEILDYYLSNKQGIDK